MNKQKITIIKQILMGYFVLICLFLVSFIGPLKFQKIYDLQKDLNCQVNESTFFLKKEIDHLSWANSLLKSLLLNENIKVEMDPSKCSLGKWYYSTALKNIKNVKIQNLLKSFEDDHNKLHISAKKIDTALKSGRKSSAIRIYREETLPALSAIRNVFEDISTEYKSNLNNSLNTTTENSKNGKTLLLIINILSIIIAASLAVIIPKRIIKELRQIVEDLDKI